MIEQRRQDPICELLPWYVNGTLGDAERARVQLHLETCEQCRRDERALSDARDGMSAGAVTPLAPKAGRERFAARLDASRPASRGRAALGWSAAAAASLVVAVLGYRAMVYDPVVFETVTGPGSVAVMDYVLEVGVTDAADDNDLSRLWRELDASSVSGPNAQGTYRVVVRLPAGTLDAVESYRLNVEADARVERAAIVAVELPVEPRR